MLCFVAMIVVKVIYVCVKQTGQINPVKCRREQLLGRRTRKCIPGTMKQPTQLLSFYTSSGFVAGSPPAYECHRKRVDDLSACSCTDNTLSPLLP